MTQVNYLISFLLLISVIFSSNKDDIQNTFPKIKINDIKEGTLLSEADENGYRDIIPNLHTNVHVDVKGMVSSTTVDQVFTNDSEKPITSGLFQLKTGQSLKYTYTYHEMKFIVDGSFIIEDETGQKVTAKPGDLFYFPKGTSITFSTPNFGLGFFCGQRGEGEA